MFFSAGVRYENHRFCQWFQCPNIEKQLVFSCFQQQKTKTQCLLHKKVLAHFKKDVWSRLRKPFFLLFSRPNIEKPLMFNVFNNTTLKN